MKRPILILLLLIGFISTAQNKDFNQFSVDVNYGLSIPVAPILENRNASDFIGYNAFSLGVRYMFNPKFGLRASYGNVKFQDKNSKEDNLKFNNFNLQGYTNLTYLIGFNRDYSKDFNLLLHGGGGITLAKASTAANNERIGNIIIGTTPLYKLADNFDLSADISYTITLKQHFGYNGQLLNPDYKSQTGSYFNFTVGFIYYFGKNSAE